MDQLSQEKIQQLLTAVGSRPGSCSHADVDARPFDWKQPRYYDLEQLSNLRSFARGVADECKTVFSRLYQDDVEVSVVSVEQCFWDHFAQPNSTECYRMTFGLDPQNPYGLVHIPDASASVWIGHILGTSELTKEDGKLSELDESFLTDIAGDLTGAISRVWHNDVRLNKEVYDGQIPLKLTGSDELLMFSLEVSNGDSDETPASAAFLICCDKLRAVAEKNRDVKKAPAVDTAQIMRQHIQRLTVPLTVTLGRAALPFREILNLEVDDIVILDNKVTDAVEVALGSRNIFHGRPARTGGYHAVVIE